MPVQPNDPARACLMHGMVDLLGVSLAEALSSGRLDRGELDAMSTRCGACTRSDDCILWMVENADGAETSPAYCLNGERLGTLRR